jgi:hypothetical protein
MKQLILIFAFLFTIGAQAQQVEADIRMLYTNADCTEKEGMWDGKKISTDIGDNYGSMYHICTYKGYRLMSEINRSSGGGTPMSIGMTLVEYKEGKKGKYKEIEFASIFKPESIPVLLQKCNTTIKTMIAKDELGKLVKDANKKYELKDMIFVPNGKTITVSFALDLDWLNIDYAEHQVSEGDTDVVRSFELKTTEFLEWLK